MDLDRYAAAEFTYPDVGASRGEFPPGYHHLRQVREIGSSRKSFDTAADILMGWDMHRKAGLKVDATTPTAQRGTVVVARLGLGPVGFTVPCRVVYVIDEPDRRGFGYGTLPGHPESGEERFVVEFDPESGAVRAHISAFSRPGRWFTRVAGPANRLTQRFMTDRYFRALTP
jgi:uncharacterized protein (UPF0548 family)